MAEAVVKHGNIREREKSDLSDIIEHNPDEILDDFKYNHVGFTSEEAAELLAKYGKNELPEKVIPKWRLFLDQFRAPMPIMIWIAIIIEMAIQNWIDTGILLLIQFTNASISFYESNKAGNAVAALKNSLKPTAICKRNGKWEVIDPTLLVPGDLVFLSTEYYGKPIFHFASPLLTPTQTVNLMFFLAPTFHKEIPADCRVNGSEIDVPQFYPGHHNVTLYKGDSCKMGVHVVRGEVEATVEFTGIDTFFGKTASLLASTGDVSHLQKVLMSFMMILVVMSVTLCLISFIYLLVKGVDVTEALSHVSHYPTHV